MKARIFYAISLLASLLMAIYFNDFYPKVLFCTLLLLPFALYGLIRYLSENLEVSIEAASNEIRKHQKYPAKIKLENSSKFPISKCFVTVCARNVYMEESKVVRVCGMAGGEDEVLLGLDFTSSCCGNIQFSISEVQIYDYLNLVYAKKALQYKKTIAIMPNLVSLPTELLRCEDSLDEVEEHSISLSKGNDFSEVSDIRGFIPGDKLSRVHWKLSARSDELMVKEFNSLSSPQVNFFLQPPLRDRTLMDTFIEIFASISNSLEHRGNAHNLIWYDGKMEKLEQHRIEDKYDIDRALHKFFLLETCDKEVNVIAWYQAQYLQGLEMTYFLLDSNLTLYRNQEIVKNFSKLSWQFGDLTEELLKQHV
jgi:hypothetical protein